ncbi:hypothetical protein CC78DRAFT_619894 [Lojkania enalia]|uniref:Homeobox domain-containing protein n=1 Tax=Lojkania enalia TaxID=147567 RepID=A0A9P4K2K6_9PLEO|nr:hypothetical protein CC78DRAFT_619894 [Didymosphaeria enalia]
MTTPAESWVLSPAEGLTSQPDGMNAESSYFHMLFGQDAPFYEDPHGDVGLDAQIASFGNSEDGVLMDWVPLDQTRLDPSLEQSPPSPPLRNNHDDEIANFLCALDDIKTTRKRGAQPRITLEAKRVLEEHYARAPYPTSRELDAIAQQTNLELRRVRNWFNNARSRRPPYPLEQIVSGEMIDHSELSRASGIGQDSVRTSSKDDNAQQDYRPTLSKESLEKLALEASTQQDPFEAWMTLEMDLEPVVTSAIEVEVAEDAFNPNFRQSKTPSSMRISRAPSVRSSRASSTGSAATAQTHYTTSSRGSNNSSFNRSRRKGRRRMEPYPRTRNRSSSSLRSSYSDAAQESRNLQYWCTFCGKQYKNQYEWARHEESIHCPRTTWVCCPNLENQLTICPFCAMASPDDLHLQIHEYFTCHSKSEGSRTFYRRDHFIQHLHNSHLRTGRFGSKLKHPDSQLGCSKGSEFGCFALADRWKRPPPPLPKDDPALHCGFCGKWLENWSQRRSHVSTHFKEGNNDPSSWWTHRLPMKLDDISSGLDAPFRCRYCRRVFHPGDQSHLSCLVWSCRFLSSVKALNSEKVWEDPFKSPFPERGRFHTWNECDQVFYTTSTEMLRHLKDIHGLQFPDSSTAVDRYFSRTVTATFEPVFLPRPESHEFSKDEALYSKNHSSYHPKSFNVRSPETLSALPSDILMDFDGISDALPRTSDAKYFTGPTSLRINQPADASNCPQPTPSKTTFRLLGNGPPRFFHSIFSSPATYYLKSSRTSSEFDEKKLGLVENPKGHVAALVMSSALVGMAGSGWAPTVAKDGSTGLVEFGMDD